MPMLVHLADLHLGASYDFLPPEIAASCKNAQLAALAEALHFANDRGAAAVLIAGDLFDTPSPPASLVSQVITLLSRANCPVLLSPGNHDYFHPDSPYETREWSQNVHIFRTAQLEPFALADGTLVWGAAFHGTSAAIPLAASLPDDVCNILLVHADILTDSAYNALQPAALAASGFQYGAFGHNHGYSGLRHAGEMLFACPGILMGHLASETGKRGFLAGTVTRHASEMQFIASNGIEFLNIDQSLSAIADDRALGKALAAQIPQNHKQVCVTITLSGEHSYAPDLPSLQQALAQVFLFASLRDESEETRDLWRYLAEETLRGAVTRRFRNQYDAAPTADSKQLAQDALLVSLAALDGEDFPNMTPDTAYEGGIS